MLSPLLCKIASWRGVKARSPRPRVRLFLQGLQNRDGPSVLSGVAGSCISLLYIEGTASLALDNVEPVATHARPEPRTAVQLVPGTAVTTIRNRWDTGEPVLSAAWLASEFEDLHARRDPLEDLVTAAMDSQVGYAPGFFPPVVIASDLIRGHASAVLDHSTNRVQEISKGPSVHSGVFSAPLSNDASLQDVRTNSPVVAPAQSVHIANLDDRPGRHDEGVAPDSALAELSGSTEEFLFGSDLNPAGDGPDGSVLETASEPESTNHLGLNLQAQSSSSASDLRTSSEEALPRITPMAAYNGRDLGPGRDAFRIQRSPEGGSELAVRFTVQAYRGLESVSHEQAAVFPSQAKSIGITPEIKLRSFEIATLTVRASADYQVTQPAATIFLANSDKACSETALYGAFRLGQSPEAFNALVNLHRPTVLRACQKLLGNWADSEDVTQFVFVMLAQSQLRFSNSLAYWLRKVARNASIASLRSRSRRNYHEHKAKREVEDDDNRPSNDLEADLEAALAQLPPALREAVQLRYLEGLSQREAAASIGCPRGTLSQRAAHGLQRLRVLLASEDALSD